MFYICFSFCLNYSVSLDPTHNVNWLNLEEAFNYFENHIHRGQVWIAVHGRDIIGYLAGHTRTVPSYRSIKSLAEIQNMFVVDTYREQGVGARLVEAFCKWCMEQGISQIKVEALSANQEAINFYRRIGFGDYILTLERSMEE